MEHSTAFFHQLIDLIPVRILKEAHQIQNHLVTVAFVKPFCGIEQLIHALFPHKPAQIQEVGGFILGIGNIGIIHQIDARAGENRLLMGRGNLSAAENLSAFLVLEEDGTGFAAGKPIQNRYHSCDALGLERGAQTLHIDAVRDFQHPAGKTCVNVGLDGIGDDHIRLFPADQAEVETQKLPFAQQIDAPSVQRGFHHPAAQSLQVLLVSDEGGADDHLVLPEKFFHQLFAEPPEHI